MAEDQGPSQSAFNVVDRMLDVVEARHHLRELDKLDPRIAAAKRAGLAIKLTRAKHGMAQALQEMVKAG